MLGKYPTVWQGAYIKIREGIIIVQYRGYKWTPAWHHEGTDCPKLLQRREIHGV